MYSLSVSKVKVRDYMPVHSYLCKITPYLPTKLVFTSSWLKLQLLNWTMHPSNKSLFPAIFNLKDDRYKSSFASWYRVENVSSCLALPCIPPPPPPPHHHTFLPSSLPFHFFCGTKSWSLTSSVRFQRFFNRSKSEELHCNSSYLEGHSFLSTILVSFSGTMSE